MKVGVPKEVKDHEYRVAITPIGVHELTAHGHEVVVQQGAGLGSQITDEDYTAAGATILPTADDVWGTAETVLKVKEPVSEEYHRMREGQTLFTYLHLAADRPLTEELMKRKVTAIAYETVELPDRTLPLLAPMSEVAGRLAPQVGAHTLMRAQGGRGVLMGGVSGVYAAKVVVIGAGVSGMNAAAIATSADNAGATRAVAPAARVASANTANPYCEYTTSSPGAANTCASCIRSSCDPLPSRMRDGSMPCSAASADFSRAPRGSG